VQEQVREFYKSYDDKKEFGWDEARKHFETEIKKISHIQTSKGEVWDNTTPNI
jgi:hypothetical protein